jgi:hypothetical protein
MPPCSTKAGPPRCRRGDHENQLRENSRQEAQDDLLVDEPRAAVVLADARALAERRDAPAVRRDEPPVVQPQQVRGIAPHPGLHGLRPGLAAVGTFDLPELDVSLVRVASQRDDPALSNASDVLNATIRLPSGILADRTMPA